MSNSKKISTVAKAQQTNSVSTNDVEEKPTVSFTPGDYSSYLEEMCTSKDAHRNRPWDVFTGDKCVHPKFLMYEMFYQAFRHIMFKLATNDDDASEAGHFEAGFEVALRAMQNMHPEEDEVNFLDVIKELDSSVPVNHKRVQKKFNIENYYEKA